MPEVKGDENTWVRVDRRGAIRPRRHPAHGRVPDAEFAGPAHQPGEARLLGGAAVLGQIDSAAAAGGARTAQRRIQVRSAAARHAGAASRQSALRHLPCQVRFLRAGLRRLRPGGRSAHQGPCRPARRYQRDLPGGSEGDGLEGLRKLYSRAIARSDFVDNLSRKLLAYALEPLAAALRRIAGRRDEGQPAGEGDTVSIPWWRPSSPVPQFRNARVPESTLETADGSNPESEDRWPNKTERIRPPSPAAPCCAAPAAPWRCPGWNRSTPSPIPRRAADFPKRFGVVFLGSGINEDHWSAEGAGADMKLSKTLEPLEPLKQKINVIDGLL